MTSEQLLRLRGVCHGYRRQGSDFRVLRDVDLEVRRGEMICLTGKSGAGKSTLLHLIAGLDRPDEGDIMIGDVNLKTLGESGRARLRARTIGIVFQAFNLLDHLSVGENVMLPAAFLRRWNGSARDRAEEVLARVGLRDRFETLPGILSGGERQRVALARALFALPALLICDEVTANLDLETAAEVVALIDELRREEDITVLAATHDENLVRLSDRCFRIQDGRLL